MTRPRTWMKLHLRTLTPMFLGGADATADPDAQWVPSIRGALRFWYRTAIAGFLDHDPVRIAAAETKVFGGAGSTNPDPTSSPLQLRLLSDPPELTDDREPRWLRNHWIVYLLGQGLTKKEPRQPTRLTRGFIPSRSGVTLGVRFHGTQQEQDDTERAFFVALWALLRHGGLGARTSRGFGAIEFTGIENPTPFRFTTLGPMLEPGSPETPDDILSTLGHGDLQPPPSTPQFPSFASADIAEVNLRHHGWDAALAELGERLRHARAPIAAGRNTMTQEWAGPIHDRPPGPLPLAGMGLPIIFKQEVELNLLDAEGKKARLASPLLIRLHQWQNSWQALVTAFECTNPPGTLTLHRNRRDHDADWGDTWNRVETIFTKVTNR